VKCRPQAVNRKITQMVFVFLLIPFMLSAASEDEDYLEAMKAYNEKKFDKAEVLFREFEEKYGSSRFIPNVRIKLAELESDFDKAAQMYRDAADKYRGSQHEAEAIYALGRLYYAKGRYSDAEEQFGRILGKFSGSVWTEMSYYSLMLSLLAQDKFGDLKQIYEDYMKRDYYTLFRNRVRLVYADSLHEQGRYLPASQLYRVIIGEFTKDEKYIFLPDVYVKLIDCYANLGNEELQKKYTAELREKFPKAKAWIEPAPEKDDELIIVQQPLGSEEKPGQNAGEEKQGSFYTIQIGAFTTVKFSGILEKKMSEKGYDVYVKKDGKFYKVQIGRYDTKQEADKAAMELSEKEKIKNYLVKKGYY